MIEFLSENFGTIIVSIMLIMVVGLVIFSMARKKKKGGSSCSGCCGCPMSGSCSKQK